MHPSLETRKKMSTTRKLQGNFRQGHKDSEETKRKRAQSQTGKHWKLSEESKENIRMGHIGLKPHSWTPESRKKASDSKKGKTPWIKGKHHSEESKMRISIGQKGKYCGANASNWKGGISFEPYCPKFNNEFKERVRAFFDYTCQMPGCGHIWQMGEKKLAVHHINYKKDACCSDDVIPLFVPVCPGSCHGKTQGKREFWEQYFTEHINEKYGGKCYLSKEEIQAKYPDLTLKVIGGKQK